MRKLLAGVIILFFTGLLSASMLAIVYNPGASAHLLMGNAAHYPFFMAF
jgi:hypothetical protein